MKTSQCTQMLAKMAETPEVKFASGKRIRSGFKFYSQDLINNLFTHPYTKIEFVQRDLGVSRVTATKYLDALADGGFVVAWTASTEGTAGQQVRLQRFATDGSAEGDRGGHRAGGDPALGAGTRRRLGGRDRLGGGGG